MKNQKQKHFFHSKLFYQKAERIERIPFCFFSLICICLCLTFHFIKLALALHLFNMKCFIWTDWSHWILCLCKNCWLAFFGWSQSFFINLTNGDDIPRDWAILFFKFIFGNGKYLSFFYQYLNNFQDWFIALN